MAHLLNHGSSPVDFLPGDTEMAARIRAFDWSRTPIGAQDTWSPSLRMMVRFLLANRFPLLLWWGPEYVSLYNDAYRPILGDKHPGALGQPGGECWAEIWDVLKPLVDAPFTGGPSTWMEDIELYLKRSSFTEETHFTIAYSPVPDETAPGKIGGVLATVHEITGKVIGERRVALLRDLGTRAAEAKTAEMACATAAQTLAAHPKDVPFAMLYLVETDRQSARLAAYSGIEGSSEDFCPLLIDLASQAASAVWPLAAARDTGAMQIVEGLPQRFQAVPSGPWPDLPRTAVVLPIASNVQKEIAGFLIAGVSPRVALDAAYKDFFQVAVVPIATAIASARAYEQERLRAQALAEIDRAKTAFFSNVSHEFRTPLTLMLGPLESLLAKTSRFQPEDQEQIATAHRNSLRLLKLVNTLLDFARIEAGRLNAIYRPVDLAALTTDLASQFRSAIEAAGIAFVVDCPPLPEPVYTDPEMWEKILLNLLSNAFKFTFSGAITVRLRAEKEAAILSVSDTGTGIPDAELPHIFERFHRVEGAKGRSFEGSGIGLALIQELARMHGGSVAARSSEGNGSVFVVSVPFGKRHLPADRIGAALEIHPATLRSQAWLLEVESYGEAGEPQLTERRNNAKPRIVVADDNADMREHIGRILGGEYSVAFAVNGEEALALIREYPPDLLLTDVMMPGCDGFQVLRAVRDDAATRALPVIFLSARAGEEARVEGIQAGADDYLVKPFTANELRARVRTHVRMARIRKEAEANLRESEARLNFALSAGKLGTWELDLATMSLSCSAQCKESFGKTADEPFTYEMFRAAIHPEDRARVTAAIDRAITSIGDYAAEYRCVWPDGSVHWISASGRVVAAPDGHAFRMGGVTLDTTASKHAGAQFETLLNQAPLGVYLVDADFRLSHVNPKARLVFGDIPDLIGRSFDEVIHLLWPKAFADEIVGIFRHTLETGEPYASPERIEERLDTHVTEYYEWRTDRIVLPDGRFGVVCYFRDISQQVLARLAAERTERALRESEERLRLATDNAEIGFWDVDVVNDVLIWPPRVKAMFGISPDVPVSMLDFYNGLHPEDRAATSEAYAAAADPKRRALYDVEYRTVGKEDGLIRWVAAKGRGVFDDRGKCIRMIGTAIDISYRKVTEARLAESEARYRALAEQVTDGIFIADPQGRYVDANGAAAEMLGYSLEELLRLSIRDVLDPAELERMPEQFRRLATGEVVQGDWRFRRKDGTVFIGDLVGRQFPGGRLQGVIRDVTERRRVEDELRRANADLEQFAYSASHDLQEPIRNVAVYSEILGTRYSAALDARASECLSFVTNGAKRMDALVKDLLAYTQCGRAQDDSTAVCDSSSVLEKALADLATAIASTGARVVAGPLPLVAAPAVQLQQVFQNLIGNAIKYRGDLVPPEVQVTAERAGNQWKFAVRDNGIGIDPDHQEKVFGIFKRLHNDDKYSGTGIGLAICQKIVERRGGRIWVESLGEGHGATFYFTLPAAGTDGVLS